MRLLWADLTPVLSVHFFNLEDRGGESYTETSVYQITRRGVTILATYWKPQIRRTLLQFLVRMCFYERHKSWVNTYRTAKLYHTKENFGLVNRYDDRRNLCHRSQPIFRSVRGLGTDAIGSPSRLACSRYLDHWPFTTEWHIWVTHWTFAYPAYTKIFNT